MLNHRLYNNIESSTKVRELWDEARKPTATWRDWRNVLFYELQPFPMMNIHINPLSSSVHHFKSLIQRVIHFVLNSFKYYWHHQFQWRHFLWWSWIYIYWKFLKFIHRVLDAGPFFIILTLLVLIFTVGLKDDETQKTNHGYMSAYSVFNKGMQSILGSVNADQLLAQYVGTSTGTGTGAMGLDPPWNENDPNENRNNPHLPPQPDQPQDQNVLNHPRPRPPHITRKSNKKLRRRKTNHIIELRQEMQRQREVAREMGFGEEGDEGEELAMNLLLDL